MRMRWLAGASLAALALAGCGGDDEEPAPTGLPSAGGGGSLTYALPELPATIDPLEADTRAEQVVSRQVHEPLVAELLAAYGGTEPSPGLALSVEPSERRTVWRVLLRPGVRFQDGTPFNASAVLENTRRWSSDPAGQELLPGLFAVDAPRPNEVRFQFRRPVSGVRALLASPRLGIVSPQALVAGPRGTSRVGEDASATGTGAFEVGGRSADAIELGRFAAWWGSQAGLGPALDAVAFAAVPSADARLDQLRSGAAQVAEPVAPSAAGATSDPLLRFRPAGGAELGFSASVRGLPEDAAVPVLSAVWLTRLAG
jgi:peptide/nickel transport system substrate-binding protein